MSQTSCVSAEMGRWRSQREAQRQREYEQCDYQAEQECYEMQDAQHYAAIEREMALEAGPMSKGYVPVETGPRGEPPHQASSAISSAIVSSTPSWTCAARKQGTAGGHYPADCEWPTCGCDPYANKVIEALEESGALKSPPASGAS